MSGWDTTDFKVTLPPDHIPAIDHLPTIQKIEVCYDDTVAFLGCLLTAMERLKKVDRDKDALFHTQLELSQELCETLEGIKKVLF